MKFYPDEEVLIQDIAKAYRTVIKELYEAGCRNIQFDDCTWGMFCDKKYWEARQQDCVTIESEAEKYLRLNNLAIEGRPEDLVITTHVCRGNYHSTWHHQAGMSQWQNICLQMRTWTHIIWSLTMSAREDLSRLDLSQMIKKVVLGLITTKSPVLESEELIKERIRQAAEYVPLERLYLSPQCGFASCEIGNKLTEEEQWAKLALVKKIASATWKE